ncbi:PorT family protein [Bacteroidia bacterium]|nr:PorT family protein [Bacteroidia bacterium]MDB9882179.1 PorT family protein [Bacteroidia bacterium]
MKKIFLALFILGALPFQSNAQQWLTIKGGGGISMVPGYGGTLPGVSINSGIGYKHQISKRLILEGDILLDTRAVSYETGVYDANDKMVYFEGASQYIQVPLTAQLIIPFKKKQLIPYRIGQPKSFFFIEGGPYFSYGTSVSTYNDPDIIALWGASDAFTADDLTPRNIDVGVTGGFGLNFSIREGKSRLVVGTRANYGMLNMFTDDRLGTASNFSAVGYLALDLRLTKRNHIKHRW